LRTQNARGPFYSLGLQVDRRKREVARAGVHAAEGSAAFPGPGPKELSAGHPRPCLGSTSTTDLRAAPGPLRWRGWVSPRVGLLSDSTPPRPHGPRCPQARKYFTIY